MAGDRTMTEDHKIRARQLIDELIAAESMGDKERVRDALEELRDLAQLQECEKRDEES